MVYFVSHGGLGNQLFQLFYALLYSNSEIIKIYHDDRYYHDYKCEIPDNEYVTKCNSLEGFVLSFRLLKILKKINIYKKEYLKIGDFVILDGYFQDLKYYEEFKKEKVLLIKNKIKSFFGEWPKMKNNETLYHLRLGDFFRTEKDEMEYMLKRLKGLPQNSVIISNRDDIFQKEYYVQFCIENQLKYYKTREKSTIELIKFMSSFVKIDSNGSTLAFWAACFGSASVFLHNEKLQTLYDYIN